MSEQHAKIFLTTTDPAHQRYKFFRDQNTEEGHFDDTEDESGTDENEPSQQLFAHSFTLWPSSKVFEKTLFGPLANQGPIPVIRHTYDDFKEFLTFMYLGYCNITIKNVLALVDLGEYYEVKLLKDQCDEFLTKNSTKIENVLKVYESLKIYSLENAMKKVMEFVAANTLAILKTYEFLEVQKETILDIVKMVNLNATQEEIFEAVKRSVQFTDQHGRKAYADVSDQAAISAIQNLKSYEYNPTYFFNKNSEIWKWKKSAGRPESIDPNYYLTRDSSGNLTLYNPIIDSKNPFFCTNAIIAKLHNVDEKFAPGSGCKLEVI
uniref:BTB domain-containing protein n=1 Tax=Panagrolaimus davidi TaxID=227884 RepID=A0A914P4M8_9BILA